MGARFQFHKGAIRTEYIEKKIKEILFQFHKGAIRTVLGVSVIISFFNFNSIKVRLEREWRDFGGAMPSFQFHKGAIRTSYATSAGSANSDFNSIKVRLELKTANGEVANSETFQFHKGAIRTH